MDFSELKTLVSIHRVMQHMRPVAFHMEKKIIRLLTNQLHVDVLWFSFIKLGYIL